QAGLSTTGGGTAVDSPPAPTASVMSRTFFRTRKTWPHVVHRTVVPASETRASSSSYSVLHRSHPTSMPWINRAWHRAGKLTPAGPGSTGGCCFRSQQAGPLGGEGAVRHGGQTGPSGKEDPVEAGSLVAQEGSGRAARRRHGGGSPRTRGCRD